MKSNPHNSNQVVVTSPKRTVLTPHKGKFVLTLPDGRKGTVGAADVSRLVKAGVRVADSAIGSKRNPSDGYGDPRSLDVLNATVYHSGKRRKLSSESPRVAGAMIRKLFPTMSQSELASVANYWKSEVNKAVDEHRRLWERSFKSTYGRPPGNFDFRISGIGDDKLPAQDKNRLRELSRLSNLGRSLYYAFSAAAKTPYKTGFHYLDRIA